MQPALDLQFVRASFPAFSQPLPAKTAFFENAGGSYTAGAVVDALMHFYVNNKVQPFGASEICHAAGEQMENGRRCIAELLGVPAGSVTIGASTTQNINTLAIACGEFSAGGKVIVSEQDHEANIGAWERMCKRNGAQFILWKADARSGELHLNELQELLDARVKLVCVTHSSNIIGSVNPVEEIIAMSRKHGARVVVDGVSYAPHRWPNLPALQPDAYCFSTYKTYATHLGILYTAPDFAELLEPQCHYFNRAHAEKHFDSAGPDHASIAALAGLGEYFTASYRHHFGAAPPPALHEQTQSLSTLMHRHETDLCAPLLEELRSMPVRILGRATMQNREANIALVSKKHSSAQLSSALARNQIAAAHGNFYAQRLLDRLGIPDAEDGVLRISFAHYNSAQDVERVSAALRECF